MIARFFRALWRSLKTPWVLALIVTLILILLVWILGPLVAIADHVLLGSVVARLVATVILMFCWGLFVALMTSRRKKKEAADPEKAQVREQEDMNRSRFLEQIDDLKTRLKTALKVVTTSNFYGAKSRSRYALPWYLMLGTSNSGKTSLLLNSGLKFPLNEQADRHLYRLKATDHCEVLYANEAVFVDTPGAYTESRPESLAHKVWTTFLRALFRIRPAQPLNGVIVCVSMREIIDTDAARREHLARTIRTRLGEVLKRLRSHVPVYLVFTKCDAVPGFAQFFAHLSRAEREQIFGCPAKSGSMEPGEVRLELKDLMQTLNAQIIPKIHQERDVPSRGEMFRFPQELAALGPRMEDFIAEAFGPSRYHRPLMFRGFYFSSALSSRDVMAAAAREGELSYQTGFNASATGDYAKGFFLLRLLENAIIPEARLAGADKNHRWTIGLRRYGMQAAAAALFLLAGVFLGNSFINNYARLENLGGIYERFTAEQKKTPSVTDAKMALPELLVMEQTIGVYKPGEDSRIAYGLGLYQGNPFEKATRSAYLGTLNSRLMPAVRAAAAQKVEQSLTNIPALKSSLRAYLMLCMPDRIERNFLDNWLDRQWSERYPGRADTQQSLQRQMDYLIANGIIPTAPDQDLLDRARKALLKVPMAELVYQHLQEEAAESGKPPYTFRAAIGQSPFDGDTHPIPYLYTRNGYDEYLIERCPEIIRDMTGEGWVFDGTPMALSAFDEDKVYKDVRALYFRDYTQQWNQALQALEVRTPATLGDARKLADELTAGISPSVLVLRELRANTDFTIESEAPGAVQGAVQTELKRRAQQRLSRRVGANVGRALTDSAAQKAEDMHKQALEEAQRDSLAVKQYFAPLDTLLDAAGNPNPALKAANDNMMGTGEYFGKLVTSDNKEQRVLAALLDIADEKDDTLRRMESAAEKLPSPARGWYSTVASGGLRDMLAIGAQAINRAYQERVISTYDKNLRACYPFSPNSSRDANLEDFSAFFRAGGVLDAFQDAYLRPFVTRTGALRAIMGRTLPVSTQAVIQLQRAARVQEAFFMSGRELGITFLMEPYALDDTLKRVSLTNAGKTLSYWHGPVMGVGFSWPTEEAQNGQAILETEDLNGIGKQSAARGEWALFRLLRGCSIKRREGNTCLIEVQQNGKWAQFLIQFRNRANPFDPSVCSFVLPESLL